MLMCSRKPAGVLKVATIVVKRVDLGPAGWRKILVFGASLDKHGTFGITSGIPSCFLVLLNKTKIKCLNVLF